MKSSKIIYIILAFLLIYSIIQLSTINRHKAEIDKLRQRVYNLEVVINRKVELKDKTPSEKLPALYFQ